MYYKFESNVNKKTFGTPIESKIFHLLAKYVTDDLLNKIILKLHVILICIKEYIDDIMVAFHLDRTYCILEIFNSFDEHIKSPIKLEDINHSIPFLTIILSVLY